MENNFHNAGTQITFPCGVSVGSPGFVYRIHVGPTYGCTYMFGLDGTHSKIRCAVIIEPIWKA